jgi:hypothetical protein
LIPPSFKAQEDSVQGRMFARSEKSIAIFFEAELLKEVKTKKKRIKQKNKFLCFIDIRTS